jgi:hypothetical protein
MSSKGAVGTIAAVIVADVVEKAEVPAPFVAAT